MAVGDQGDILQRLQNLMPPGWFAPGATPIRDALLAGIANAFAFIFSLFTYLKLQTRIATATDGFLDLISFDFFGGKLPRAGGQADSSFRNQIIAFLFRQRNTREAIILVIQQLLGTTPAIIEPQRAGDAIAIDCASTVGIDVAGVVGDGGMPLQCFVTVTLPTSLAIATPMIAGYGIPFGGYGIGQMAYASAPTIDPVQAADIYAALESVRPVTGVIWTRIQAAA